MAILVSVFAVARNSDSLETLKKHLAAKRDQDRPPICLEIAEKQMEIADKLYAEGKTEPATAALEDVAIYSEQARDAAVLTGKHLKDTEITARRLQMRLVDIKRTLSFEDQAPAEKAISRLEQVRISLLKKMFPGGTR